MNDVAIPLSGAAAASEEHAGEIVQNVLYNESLCCMIHFDIRHQQSMEDAFELWLPDVRKKMRPDAVIAIVATTPENADDFGEQGFVRDTKAWDGYAPAVEPLAKALAAKHNLLYLSCANAKECKQAAVALLEVLFSPS